MTDLIGHAIGILSVVAVVLLVIYADVLADRDDREIEK